MIQIGFYLELRILTFLLGMKGGYPPNRATEQSLMTHLFDIVCRIAFYNGVPFEKRVRTPVA